MEKIQAAVDDLRANDDGLLSNWSWLWYWLPNISWLHTLIIYAVVIFVILILLCCCILCIPSLISTFRDCCQPRSPVGLTRRQLYHIKYHALPSIPAKDFEDVYN